jgi:hypothetical protein
MKELLGMVVRKDDPEIGCQGLQPGTDLGRRGPHPLHHIAVLGFGHREELRGMGQHRPTDYARTKGSALHHQLRLRSCAVDIATLSGSWYRHRKSYRLSRKRPDAAFFRRSVHRSHGECRERNAERNRRGRPGRCQSGRPVIARWRSAAAAPPAPATPPPTPARSSFARSSARGSNHT